MRDLVRYPEKKNEILGSVFALKLTGGGVALLLAFAVIWFLQPGDTKIHWMVGIIAAGMVFQAFDVADLLFQAKVQSRFTVVAKNTAFLVLAAVKVCLILRQADVVAFAWAGTAEIALGALGLFVAFQLNWKFMDRFPASQGSHDSLAQGMLATAIFWPGRHAVYAY